MEIEIGVFNTTQEAENVVEQLRKLGLGEKQIGYLSPNPSSRSRETRVPVSDTEAPGTGRAMGAAVGGAMGAAGGATLGLVAATLMVPGVGPVIAFGFLGAALIGSMGAAAGAVVGDSLEEGLGEGFPHEDIYVYQDALRNGKSLVIAYAKDDSQADRARAIMRNTGAVDIDKLRENWWHELREQEASHYGSTGMDFQRDELSYRKGFEAAQHPARSGATFADAQSSLRESFTDEELDNAFRCGYERGCAHRLNLRETPKD